MDETKILSKNADCWNSLTFMRCAGRRVMSLGKTKDTRSCGRDLEHKKRLLADGTVEEDEKIFLYVDRFWFVFKGEV